MQIGRNELCRCGSGRKYKKCCLLKDRQVTPKFIPPAVSTRAVPMSEDDRGALLKAPAPRPSVAPREVEPVDPLMAAINARWDEFESLDYEGQIALFVKTLDDEALMDSEMAFSMLEPLYIESLKRSDADRFDILARALRERRPSVFADNAIYILPWLISNALAARRFDEMHQSAIEFGAIAYRNIDLFEMVFDELAYHERLSTLVEMMRVAWPQIRDSGKVTNWGVAVFAERAVGYELFEYLESAVSPNANDPALTERLAPYIEFVDMDLVAKSMNEIIGRESRIWSLADFQEQASGQKGSRDSGKVASKDPVRISELPSLTREFVGYLRSVEGVSYSKGDLGRQNLERYLCRRSDGDLDLDESTSDLPPRSRKRAPRQAPKRAPRQSDRGEGNLLCPEPETMDRFLASLTDFMVAQYYGLAATFELLPAWLRFLESRQLLDAPQRTKTLADFAKLGGDVRRLLSMFAPDPSLKRNLDAAWLDVPLLSDAELHLSRHGTHH